MQTTDLEIVWHNFTPPWDYGNPVQGSEVLVSADNIWYMFWSSPDAGNPTPYFFAFDPSNDSIVAVYSGFMCEDYCLMLPNGSFAIMECDGTGNQFVSIIDARLQLINTVYYDGPVLWMWLSMGADVLFVGHCNQPELVGCNITATNLTTAENVWSVPVPVSYWQFAQGLGYPAISEDGSRIYVMIMDTWKPIHTNMSAFSTTTGELLWSRELGLFNTQPCFTDWTGQSLVAGCGDGSDGGTVFAGCFGSSFFAVNGSDGSIKWTFDVSSMDKVTWDNPLPICGGGSRKQDIVLVSSYRVLWDSIDYRAYVLDMQTGKQLNSGKKWSYELMGAVSDANGTLFFVGGTDEDNPDSKQKINFIAIDPVTSTVLASELMLEDYIGGVTFGSITNDGRYINAYWGSGDYGLIFEVRPAGHWSARN
eukprot:TRINITY_DN8935_c0_g1_i1.p1 TRINITY_DN8935_c0_g1~~TRINITY_DN8935_c0_g1_i1.p1  ORF type:complete len:421 (-),score=62.78 TRINITY_DN8935_c0_g1_i1:139-1401(-)